MNISTEQMTTEEQMIVRACKSKNRIKRLHSTYKRFYSNEMLAQNRIDYLSIILLDFCFKWKLMDIKELSYEIGSSIRLEPDLRYNHRILLIMSSAIRYIGNSKMEDMGYRPPLKFRKK